uniref:Uncharacterized protein n=1 Tax=Anguilla anguilla TaxID=7936 RepID=A0A0E9UW67_ANGAN
MFRLKISKCTVLSYKIPEKK